VGEDRARNEDEDGRLTPAGAKAREDDDMTGLLLVALLVGLVLPLQAGINSQLRIHVGHPLWAALVSFSVGTCVLALVLAVTRVGWPEAGWVGRVPWWQWTGGLLGATFVTSSIVLAPRLGAAVLIATVVAGQMVGSLFVDHYGAVGYPQHAVSVSRVVGVALIVAGVALIQYR
jgi:transporter family-2 protein|tara:strand:+ start:12235 stop:12756 length:522 start_codon:yes stop_codon:yes gene_type:complete